VEVSPSAARELLAVRRREPALYKRIAAAIDSLAEDPYQGKKLKGKLAGNFSMRVGAYRILYRVFKDRLLIWVIDLGPRREIYR
jgi:mRNA interferase RelE/StbE